MTIFSVPVATGVPRRISLAAQTAGILKEGLRTGRWSGELPGELELAGQLQVSRVTLRKALAGLEREGWVRAGQGRRRQIVARPARGSAAGRRVLLLTAQPLHRLPPQALYWMDCLREQLAEAGYHLEPQTGQAAFGARPEAALERLHRQFHPAGWVLYQSTARMQEWFSRAVLPCVIAGSVHPEVRLPSVDLNYRAVCRHAAGQFLARGHTRLGFLCPGGGAAGDRESEQGFLEATEARTSAEGTVIRHDGTVAGICHRIDALLARPHPPTALLVARPAFVLTTLTHLLRRQRSLPGDLALISRDDEAFLADLVPTVARYAANPTVFARKISRRVLETVRGAPLTRVETKLMPAFIPGQTLG